MLNANLTQEAKKVSLPRALDFIFPALLFSFVPFDILLGLTKGYYPTQGTLVVLLGAVIGFYMLRRLLQPRRAVPVASADPETVANAVINRRLNSGLGAAFLGLASVLVIFGLVMLALAPARPIPFNNLTTAKLVELGFIILFNLMGAALEAFGARVYLLGRR